MDQAPDEHLDRRFREFREGFREDLRTELAASAAETRRHMDVVTERLMSKLQLVAEGIIGVDQKLDRLATEMRGEFKKVDQHFLHLEARVLAPRD